MLLSFRLLNAHKQFSFSFLLRKWKDDQMRAWCDHKAILWNGFQVWNNSWKMFLETKFNQFGVPAKSLKKENDRFVRSFCWRFYREIVYICDAHKMLYFCNQNGIVTFCQSCLLVRFLVNTATFVWENFGFLSFSVIVTFGR